VRLLIFWLPHLFLAAALIFGYRTTLEFLAAAVCFLVPIDLDCLAVVRQSSMVFFVSVVLSNQY
jgi:hypothetical protein